jgi:VanZ family protein
VTPPPAPRQLSRWDDWYRRTLPAYWIFLFCVTHLPKLELDLGVSAGDKIAHFVAYGLLAFLLWRFAEGLARPLSGRFAVWAAVGIALYGALDEWTQPAFGRSASVFDWVNDVVGSVFVLGLLEWRRRRLGRAAAGAAAGDVDSPADGR